MRMSPYHFVREVIFSNDARATFIGLDDWMAFTMLWWCIGYEASNKGWE